MLRLPLALIAVLFVVATTTIADDLPAGGKPLIATGPASLHALNVRLGDGKLGTYEISKTGHTEFQQSLNIALTEQPGNTWDAAAGLPITSSVAKDDVLLVGFWMRGKPTSEVGGAVAEFVFERFSEPYTKSVQYLAETPADGSWQQYWVRFRSVEDYDAGQAGINFQLGYQPETLEIGGLQAWNFGKDIDVNTLPNTELTYAGRSLDASWRADAAKRIDELRKRDVSLAIRDRDGNPRPGAKVSVKLERHLFGFGSAVSAPMLTGNGEDNDRYRNTFKQYFNVGTIENGLKWKSWDNQWISHRETIDALRWMNEAQIPARGHVMVWPGIRYLPEWVPTIYDRPDVLSKVIDSHIREMGFATSGMVRDWDVLNEVFDNRDLTDILGDEAMVNWFKVAKDVAPDAELYYNDYAGLVRGGFPTAHKEHFVKTVRYLTTNNAPIDGIGIQGHFGALLTPPERMLAELDRYHELGLKVLITEYDVEVPGKELQSDFTRDFLTTCFSHPAVEGVVTWGFWAGAHWKPEAALFAKDWTPTAMGQQWIHMTQNEWTTQQELVADVGGKINFRGFLGQYVITVDGEASRINVTRDGEVIVQAP
ncbi:endo-1,4-beta-xylanase [Rubripirellula reticaptiva]|uniref:Beta-xylanase n=1 Tax=Rubripirellula reticaptiva TaxID=2528013 RepID=A0A5C6F245_9BACT|nr:endo-1,4-beta-xylanase [Rubripirellula reticaptiva]TWU55312.1 Endo-1,4-beta-xylanase Z precursor [Rubripirellula reticaptiva]